MYSVEVFLDQLANAASSAPATCTSEACILQWTIHETQVIQSIYDSALDAGLPPEEIAQVEDLYKSKLQDVFDIALASLGANEV